MLTDNTVVPTPALNGSSPGFLLNERNIPLILFKPLFFPFSSTHNVKQFLMDTGPDLWPHSLHFSPIGDWQRYTHAVEGMLREPWPRKPDPFTRAKNASVAPTAIKMETKLLTSRASSLYSPSAPLHLQTLHSR